MSYKTSKIPSNKTVPPNNGITIKDEGSEIVCTLMDIDAQI